ncbi:MAG: polysaccharide deacetylase family protein [Gemmatimonadetes bacterium]|nr:polysaccharide deacetylase family protein [Gemmatimonadota bacterium]
MVPLRHALLSTLLLPGADLPLRPLMRSRATIFMLHRFTDPELGIEGTDPAALRRALAWLRKANYPLLSLNELFLRLASGTVPDRTVAFTIDDGYLDQATVAAPIFAEFDVPVTTFLTSGYLDRTLWFWWDRIEYAFEHATRAAAEVELGGERLRYAWTTPQERRRAQGEFTERCKRVPDAEKHEGIGRLAAALEVELPQLAPARYAPMSWDDARRVEQGTMTFGPHTVTHPIMARATDPQATHEITESWRRLQQELPRPDPIFCYPNGQPGDFGPREIAACRAAGLVGAVVGSAGYVDPGFFQQAPENPFLVRRFSMPDQLPVLAQYASGLERFKDLVRGTAG